MKSYRKHLEELEHKWSSQDFIRRVPAAWDRVLGPKGKWKEGRGLG